MRIILHRAHGLHGGYILPVISLKIWGFNWSSKSHDVCHLKP